MKKFLACLLLVPAFAACGEKINVEVAPGKTVQMSPDEYKKYQQGKRETAAEFKKPSLGKSGGLAPVGAGDWACLNAAKTNEDRAKCGPAGGGK